MICSWQNKKEVVKKPLSFEYEEKFCENSFSHFCLNLTSYRETGFEHRLLGKKGWLYNLWD